MTQAEVSKLTAELEQLNQLSQPAPDWTGVDELIQFQYEIANPLPESAPIQLNYAQCVAMYKSLDRECKERKERMEDIRVNLQAALLLSGVKKVMAVGIPCQIVEKAGNKKISAAKLMAKGVSAQIIAESTEVGKGSNYLLIGAAKEE